MGHYGGGYGGWAPYVPVAQRRRNAMKKMEALKKKGTNIQPVTIEGNKIARSFWGKGWCDHLESFSDFANRLPRGRSYVRNGSVCHMDVAQGAIEAMVSGSDLYTVKVSIKTLQDKKWIAIKGRCGGQIGSLLELLQGKLSDRVMEVVTDQNEGLFPLPGEMSFACSCPDFASMCKHVAAVLYGVGSRLDTKPELLFMLRGVNHEELIEADAERAVAAATSRGKSQRIADDDIGAVFGIEIDTDNAAEIAAAPSGKSVPKNNRSKATPKKAPPKKATTKKVSGKAKIKKSVKTATAKKATAKMANDVEKPAKDKTAQKPTASRRRAKSVPGDARMS